MNLLPDLRRRLLHASSAAALVDELERAADDHVEVTAFADALHQAGLLAEEVIPERARALELHVRAAALCPSHARAGERARALALHLGRLELVVELCEQQLAEEHDPAHQAELVATLAETELELGHGMRALELVSDWAPLLPPGERLDELRAVVDRGADWERDVEHLLVDAGKAESRDAARLLVRAARIVGASAPDDPRREQLLLRALERDPRCEAAARLVEQRLADALRWDALVAQQERRVSSLRAQPVEASALCVELALRWWELWLDEDRALVWLDAAVAMRVGLSLAALALGERLLGARGEHGRLVALVEHTLGVPSLPPETVLHAALLGGRVSWQGLGDPEAARAFLDRAALLAPEHASVAALGQALERRLALAVEDRDERRLRLTAVARLTIEKPHEVPQSIAEWNEVLTLAPTSEEALAALAKLLEAERRFPELAVIVERQLELERDPARRATLLLRLALLYTDELDDGARAVATWRRLLVEVPSHPRAQDVLRKLLLQRAEWQDLENLYGSLGKLDECVRVFERQVEVEDDRNKVDLWVRVARIYRDELGRPERARRAFENVLSLDSTHLEAAEGLIPYTLEEGDAARCVQLLEIQLDQTTDPALRQERYARLSSLCELRMGDKEAAFRWRSLALDEEPASEATVVQLERLAGELRAWSLFAQTLRDALGHPLSVENQVLLRLRLGHVYHQHLQQPERALDLYKQVLARQPGHAPTLAALALLLDEEGGTARAEAAALLAPLDRAAGRWERLLRTREVQLEGTTEPAQRQLLLARMAELAEKELGDGGVRALEYWARALAEDPRAAVDGIGALEGAGAHRADRTSGVERGANPVDEIERLARATGRPDALVQTLLEVVERVGEHRDLLVRAARAVEGGPLDEGRSAELYERALAVAPRDPEVLAALDLAYERMSRHRELATVLEQRLAVAGSPSEIVPLALRLARVEEELLGAPERAVLAFRQVLEHEPHHRDAIASLERIHVAQHQWQPLSELYDHLLHSTTDPVALANVYARLARLATATPDGSERALECWTRVLELQPGDHEAVAGLSAILARQEQWAALVELLEKQVNRPSSDDDPGALSPLEQAALWRRIGRLWQERLASDGDALMAWMNADHLVPGDLETLRALVGLLDGASAWQELVGALRQLLDSSEIGDDEAFGYATRLGHVEADLLGRLDEATLGFRHALALRPGDVGALEALQEVLLRAGHWRDYVEILEERASLAGAEGAPELLLQAAATRESQLSDRAGAARLYEQVLVLRPGDALALERLEAWLTDDAQPARLAALVERRAASLPAGPERSRKKHEAARLREDLGDRSRAFTLAREAWHDAPTSEALEREVVRLGTALERWEDLLDDRLASIAEIEREDPVRALEAWLHIAHLAGERLGRLDDAQSALEAARRLAPEDARLLEALGAVYRRRRAWVDLFDVQQKLLSVESEPARILTLLRSQAEILDDHLGDVRGAINAWRAVAGVSTDVAARGSALLALERLLEQAGDLEALLELLGQQRDDSDDDGERAVLFRKMVAVWERGVGDPDGTMPGGGPPTLRFDPAGAGRYRDLEQHYRREKRWRWLLCAYRRHLDETDDRGSRIDLLCAMGKVHDVELGDAQRAAACYLEALDAELSEPRALEALERIYEARGRWPEDATLLARLQRGFAAAEQWRGEIAVTVRLSATESDPLRRGRLLHQAGILARDRAARSDEATAHFQGAFESYVRSDARAALEAAVETSIALDQLFAARADWRGLETSYRWRIERLPRGPGDALLIGLWTSLAELCRARLGDERAAAHAREVATALAAQRP